MNTAVAVKIRKHFSGKLCLSVAWIVSKSMHTTRQQPPFFILQLTPSSITQTKKKKKKGSKETYGRNDWEESHPPELVPLQNPNTFPLQDANVQFFTIPKRLEMSHNLARVLFQAKGLRLRPAQERLGYKRMD
jgi:hypothetical protein